MTTLFSARSVAPDGAETLLEALLDGDAFQLRAGTRPEDQATFSLGNVVGDRTGAFEATLALGPAEIQRWQTLGLIGLVPAGAVQLAAVRIVVRPAERNGGHTSEHPFFALYLDWTISAKVADGSKFGELDVAVGADTELTLTTGLSCIYPPALASALGMRALQVRVDLDFLAATTGWMSLALFDGGASGPHAMPGLLEWFRRLVGQAGAGALPDWSADLRLKAALPLGLRFQQSYLAMTRRNGAYLFEARASGLVLTWAGDDVFEYEDAAFFLTFSDNAYLFRAVLFSAQYPKAGATGSQPSWAAGLPFGTLHLRAEAWRITAGLIAVRQGGGPIQVCPELIIELAGVSLASGLWADGEPIWSARAARLHLRRLRVLTCKVADDRLLFADVEAGNWLAAYRDQHKPRVERLSGVASAAPEQAQASFPLEFLDGAFDRDSHVFLLWKQDNAALFDRLTQIVPGLASGRTEPADPLLVGFELARFAGGDLQARLEWRAAGARLEDEPEDDPAPLPAGAPTEICGQPKEGKLLLNLPSGGEVAPQPIAEPDLRLDLPLIEVALAKPASRSLLFYRPAGERPVLSLLHVYRKPPAEPSLPILYAAIDLSLEHDGERELLPTTASIDDPPFIALAFGTSKPVTALAVVAWREGERPQIMRGFEGGANAFAPLIPDTVPENGEGDCTGCPAPSAPRAAPLALAPDRFGTPQAADPAGGWTLALQLAASRQLRSFLPQANGGDSLVSLAVTQVCYVPADAGGSGFLPPLRIEAELAIRLAFAGAGNELTGKAVFQFDPSDMSLKLIEGGVLDLELACAATPLWAARLGFPIEPEQHCYSDPVPLFGLEASFYRKKPADGAASATFLTLDLRGGRFAVGLSEGSRCLLRYADLGGDALVFDVSHFLLGSGGLDVEASLIPAPLRVKGLSNPFQLDSANLSMVASRMRRLTVSGSGKLPEILSYAPIAVTLTLAQAKAGGPIDLEELSCVLSNGDEPIFTSGVRYRFDVTALSLRYAREGGGGRHFFFEVSGSAQFEPEPGEFDGGLLENLRSARIEFTRAPLSDEFTDHLVFVVELNEPVTFKIFDLFRMEIRSFGFAPKHAFPTPAAALIIGGQCEFGDVGDVISAEIDFHRLYIGLPRPGESLPQVEFKNLRVEIRTEEGFRIGGTVASYHEKNREGFAGDGFIAIPGFPQLGAAFAFMRLRHPTKGWKRAWFIALEASAISYQIPPLPIYLRHVGLGFGYRMTSVLLREQPPGQTVPQLVDYLLAALDQHQTLARLESWADDLEEDGRARWTVAMEGVLTLGTTQGDPFVYDPKKEVKLRTIVLQMLAAMRSDLTLVAGAKLWFPVSYDDFLNDRLNMRRKPFAKGFVHYAPRQQRLLAYARKEKNAYYGPPDDPLTKFVQNVLEPMPFECVALVEPSRVRGEIGWPDRLVFPISLGPLKLECRGGILFAVEKGAAIYGLYFSARGELSMSGGAGGGSLGLRLSAQVKVHFATRLLMARPLLSPAPSHIYGQVGIDINIRFSVEAWFKFKIGFAKIRLKLSFSISLQVLVALEVGLADQTDIGFKGRATVMIGVFGRRLRASVAVGINESGVDRARAALKDYMSSLLEPGKVPPVPGEAGGRGAAGPLTLAAVLAAEKEDAPPPAEPFAFAVIPLPAAATETGSAADRNWLLWIMPTPTGAGFYPVPDGENEAEHWATISNIPDGAQLYALDNGKWTRATSDKLNLSCCPNKAFEADTERATIAAQEDRLTLRNAIAGCYQPAAPDRFERFPFDFAGDARTLLKPVAPDCAARTLEDDRVQDGPRHTDAVLNPANHYDAALAAAIDDGVDDPAETPEARSARLIKQAQGSQAFLLRGFQDEIDVFVAKAGPAPEQVSPHDSIRDPGKPSVWDTGMVLLLKAPQLPDWVRRRDPETEDGLRPIFTFNAARPGEPLPVDQVLRPLVEPDGASLAGGNTALRSQPIAHFDDELLALSWQLDWSGKKPAAAPGIGREVHDFLRHYRVELYDLSGGGKASLTQRLVLPANVLARRDGDAGRETVELKPPYNFTIPVSELFPDARAVGQELRRILANITPVGQAGEEGTPFSILAVEEPRSTPLPADGAALSLSIPSEDGPLATLTWEEPALPNRAGIADTDEWQLILRKLPQVPLGHYPQTADGDAEDATGQLAFDRTLRPGDLILRMPKHAFDRPKPNQKSKDDRQRAEYRFRAGSLHYTLDLHAPLHKLDFTWVDVEGKPIFPDTKPLGGALQALVNSFRGCTSALAGDGHAWQLFLRARSNLDRGGSDAATYSAISPIRLKAILRDGALAASGAAPAEEAAAELPLQHFEWPRRIDGAALAAPSILAGRLHVPLANFDAGAAGLLYCPSADMRRVVSASWSGFVPAADGKQQALAACAGFRLWERIEDGRTNQEIAEGYEATQIALFDVAHPRLAAASPATLSETQNWRSWSPAQASILRWLAEPGERPTVVPDARRSWHGWSDADLVWPPVIQAKEPVPEAEADRAPRPRANLHPLLVAFLQMLKRDWADPAGFVLEVAAGKLDMTATSRLGWMERNTEALDPYGWAALWHLGLAFELSARDAVSARPVAQRELRRQCETKLGALLKPGGDFHELARHVALDCPLQANAGLAGGATGPALDDVALDRVQIALRPIAQVREHYCIVAVPDRVRPFKSGGGGGGDAKPHRLHWLRFEANVRPRGLIEVDLANQELAALRLQAEMRPGSELLLKFKIADRDALEQVLKRIAAIHAPRDPREPPLRYWFVERPISLPNTPDDAVPVPLWPHGQFADDSRSAEAVDALHDRFCDYLKASPLPDREPSGSTTSRAEQPDFEPDEKGKIVGRYPDWARRFFAVAPLAVRTGPFAFTNANVATAAPRSEATDIVGPGRDGDYRYNRLVNWQWATTRALLVEGIGRYERLLDAMAGASPASAGPVMLAAARADGAAPFQPYYLSRIRQVEAPQLLGDRIVRAEGGRYYHELTIARHEEDGLQEANIRLARQLEFAGTRMRYRRVFRYPQWAKTFPAWAKAQSMSSEVPAPLMSSPTLEWMSVPRFDEADATYLQAMPAARFGAVAALTACEPYFYETALEVQALAGAHGQSPTAAVAATAMPVKSAIVERPLGPAPAGAMRPQGIVPMQVSAEAWGPELADDHRLWLDAFGGGDALLIRALGPSGLTVRVRHPRYFESLAEREHAVEAAPATVGTLPDSETAVHLTRRVEQADAPICVIRIDPDEQTAPFQIVPVSPDLELSSSIEVGSGWSAGVWIELAIRAKLAAPAAVPGPSGLVAARLPLTEAESDQLFDPARLPAWGALAGAAPLALRLRIEPSGEAGTPTVSIADPFAIRSFMARPLTVLDKHRPVEPGDLARGLQLLIDPERMVAAKAALYLGDSSTELLGQIERAASAACRERPVDGISGSVWEAWAPHLDLWGLAPAGEQPARWVRLAAPPTSETSRLIAIARNWTEGAEPAFAEFLKLKTLPGAVGLDAPGIRAIAALCETLAAQSEQQVAKSRGVDLDASSITAWVQRGNATRGYWAGRQPDG